MPNVLRVAQLAQKAAIAGLGFYAGLKTGEAGITNEKQKTRTVKKCEEGISKEESSKLKLYGSLKTGEAEITYEKQKTRTVKKCEEQISEEESSKSNLYGSTFSDIYSTGTFRSKFRGNGQSDVMTEMTDESGDD